MEIREFAERILFANTLEEKLAAPSGQLSDHARGSAILSPGLPGRPADLLPKSRGEDRARFPRDARLIDETERARLLHFFANHELLAVELMALALLKFPDAPEAFRSSVVETLQEEQEHTRWYCDRMAECGLRFGDIGVSRMIWDHIAPMQSPLEYVGRLSLTFEQSNLDYAKHYSHVLREAGDNESAAILGRIYRDEIKHVGLGLHWLRRWKEQRESDWEAFRKTLKYPLSPVRAKGVVPFNEEGRRKAGFDDEFIRNVRVYEQSRGRTPDVYWFNPLAEEEWSAAANGQVYHPGAKGEALAADLEPTFALVAHHDDVMLVRRLPSLTHREYLHRMGIVMPELVLMQNARETLAQRRLHAPFPWASAPSVEKNYLPIVGQFASSLTVTSPELFSKASAARAMANLAASGFDTGPVSVVVNNAEEAMLAGKNFADQGWRDLVAKPLLGLAGRGQRRFTAGECPTPDLVPSVIEPWLDKVFEFSAHFDATGSTLNHKGFVRMQTDRAGRWKSCEVGQKFLKGLPGDLATFLSNHLAHYEEAIKTAVENELTNHPHHGPLGIDAFVWRDSYGALRLRPIVEINPRWTMGRVALSLQRKISPHRWLRLHTLNLEQAAHLLPPELRNGKPWSGTIPLTDPSSALHHVIAISISQTPQTSQ